MIKLFMPVVLLLSVQAIASVKEVTINCATPAMLAGGASIKLTGKLKIVISPSTGMTKIKAGSFLSITKSVLSRAKRETVQENILVSGNYYESSNKIDANQEPTRVDRDDRTYSEITIDGENSSIFQLEGNKRHLLSCARL